ncbi:MAG: CDP-alcohol phosphatidyltransferase family protein [Polaribacter sp.]|nr:CDP-alcohol phosphatidyltransferase family protein [Polaribacter sp.]
MTIKKHLPNLLTLGNLLCGTIAVIFAVQEDFLSAALFVVLGIIFDFFDGFVARLLKVSGELGKQLDSLADMVTSGVVPGIVMFQLLKNNPVTEVVSLNYLPYIGLLLTLAACYRLATFNLDTRQTDSFIGLPTPAMSLFVIALPLISMYTDNEFFIGLVQNKEFLIAVTLVLSYLMNAEIPLFSLKFKNFGLKENKLKFFFLLASIALIVSLKVLAIPLVIVLYVLLSVGSNLNKKKAA